MPETHAKTFETLCVEDDSADAALVRPALKRRQFKYTLHVAREAINWKERFGTDSLRQSLSSSMIGERQPNIPTGSFTKPSALEDFIQLCWIQGVLSERTSDYQLAGGAA